MLLKDLVVQNTQEGATQSQGATQSSQVDKCENLFIDYEDAFVAGASRNYCPVLFEDPDGTVMMCEHTTSRMSNMITHIITHFEKATTKEQEDALRLMPNFKLT